jgi:hypothetical protein
LSLDEDGLFLGGDFALIFAETSPDGRRYRVRSPEAINPLLSKGYGAPIDIASRMPDLHRIADFMTRGEWGLAQISALHLRMAELPDDRAVQRLLKADKLERFNPNHKPPGPGGGQFTSGSEGGGADENPTGNTNPPAGNPKVPQLSYRTTSGAPNTPYWGTEFLLSRPSPKGGYIVQKIETTYEFGPGFKMVDEPFWEAFRVYPGATKTRYVGTGNVGGGDDWWGGEIGPGEGQSHGVQIDIGTARFYEGLTERQLIRRGFRKGKVGPIGGNVLMNTDVDPKLPDNNASNAIVRESRNHF